MLVTPTIGLIIFGMILLVAFVVAWYMQNYDNFDKSSFHTFVVIIAGFSIFITFMFYWNLLQLQAQQQQLAAVQELARINDSVLNSVLDSINNASVIIPNFVLSITPLTNTVCCNGSTGSTGSCLIPVPASDPITPQTCTEKMSLSYRIFALWQDFVTSNRYMHYDCTSYIANFLQKANSPQLYAQWTAAYIDFNDHTQQLGVLLFEYGLPITDQTAVTYEAAAQKLVADPRFQEVVTSGC